MKATCDSIALKSCEFVCVCVDDAGLLAAGEDWLAVKGFAVKVCCGPLGGQRSDGPTTGSGGNDHIFGELVECIKGFCCASEHENQER